MAPVDVAQRAEYRRHCGRCQQVRRDHPRQVGNVLELPANGRQRRGDDGLVKCGQKHRQHQAHQDGADFAWSQRRLWGERRRIAEFDDLSGYFRQVAFDDFGQRLLVSRSTALPFKLVHIDVC